jgi:hypothetical protein
MKKNAADLTSAAFIYCPKNRSRGVCNLAFLAGAPTVFLRTLNNNVSAFWHEHCMLKSANHLFIDGDCMLVTLVALLCNGQLCLEKVVTTSDQSSITMMDCQMHAQAGIAEWLQNGPYRSWKLQSYKCIAGKYVPKSQA